MEGPYLPEGSGGEEPPAYPQMVVITTERGVEIRASEVYNARMWLFENGLSGSSSRKRRRRFSDYTAKNCEEAWTAGAQEGYGLG